MRIVIKNGTVITMDFNRDKYEKLDIVIDDDKIVDISHNTLYKIKKKIRRSTRRFRKWMINKNINEEIVLKTIIKKYNKKFFGKDNSELSWKYWFFPTINTTKSLKIIDQYFQQELRYLITGKHNKKNFQKVPYSLLKKCNYKSLVNEYYKTISSHEKQDAKNDQYFQ